MSPVNIIGEALAKGLDMIAITDHNSTKHCRLAQEIGRKNGITVLAGAEINTVEEIHCLTFFENIEKADLFQQFIDEQLMVIRNKPEIFGHQYIVDEAENILGEEERLLVASLQAGIDKVAARVKELNGIFIPAHINRPHNGLYSQLGFIPDYLDMDGLEVSRIPGYEEFINGHPEISGYCLVTNSDAHHLEHIGASYTRYLLEKPCFEEIRLALKNKGGRKVSWP